MPGESKKSPRKASRSRAARKDQTAPEGSQVNSIGGGMNEDVKNLELGLNEALLSSTTLASTTLNNLASINMLSPGSHKPKVVSDSQMFTTVAAPLASPTKAQQPTIIGGHQKRAQRLLQQHQFKTAGI